MRAAFSTRFDALIIILSQNEIIELVIGNDVVHQALNPIDTGRSNRGATSEANF